MARQTGSFPFEGTIGIVTGYRMHGRYYARVKSSLDRKRILSDDRFIKTRKNAKWFGQAQKIAKQIYRELPPDQRDQHHIWYPLRNKAQLLLRKDLPREEIFRLLRTEFLTPVKQQADQDQPPIHVGLSSLADIASSQPAAIPANTKKQPAPVKEIADEIFLGRQTNKAVELSLIDQLAAARGLVQTLLSTGTGDNYLTSRLRSKRMLRVLEKFRR